MEKQRKLQNKKQQGKLLKTYNLKLDLTKKLGLNIPKEDKYIIPIFIPHRGCKNECVFCNQRKISGELRTVTPEDVKVQIAEWLKRLSNKNRAVEIAFFGGSFTGLEISEQEAFLKVANEYIKEKKVSYIKLSTRPDYINEEILTMLKKYNVECIEIGVQSMTEDVLVASKRGHTAQDVEKASKLIHKFGFKLGHQLMIGLPESTLEKELYSIKKCLKLKPDVIRIYPVYVLKNSKLYDMTLNNDYIPLKLEEAIKRTAEVYKLCVKHNVNVIRIGLQTTEEINQSSKDILGPVCDNYKERILGYISKEEVTKKIKKIKKCNLNILVPKNNQTYIIGNKRENIHCYEELTDSNVKVKCNK